MAYCPSRCVDKLSRAVLDGVNQNSEGKSNEGRLWGDDSLVIELFARKFYADDRSAGANITVIPL